MTQTIKFPEIKEITVRPEAVDEWYGVEVRVKWKEPFDIKEFGKANKDEMERWFKENPKRCHVGPWPLEQSLQAHVVAQVLASHEWAKFYEKPRFITCEDGEDGPERRVQIPRFRAEDFTDFGFHETDGWLSASDR